MPGMVNHGEQDTYTEDLNDELDVFYPDGMTVRPVLGRAAIADLYRTTFQGRPMYRPGIDTVPAVPNTDWITID
jgi:hypothetical protein